MTFRTARPISGPGHNRTPPLMPAGMAFPPGFLHRAPVDFIRPFPVPFIIEILKQLRGSCLQICFAFGSQLPCTVRALRNTRFSLPAVRRSLPLMPFCADPPDLFRTVKRNLCRPDSRISGRMPLSKKLLRR